jgi:hypothetical protein
MANAAPHDQLTSLDELASVWEQFRAGAMVACAKDGGPLALAVDAGAGAYRFVCTSCGNSSPWFECGPAGLRVRSTIPALGPATVGED